MLTNIAWSSPLLEDAVEHLVETLARFSTCDGVGQADLDDAVEHAVQMALMARRVKGNAVQAQFRKVTPEEYARMMEKEAVR